MLIIENSRVLISWINLKMLSIQYLDYLYTELINKILSAALANSSIKSKLFKRFIYLFL